jgi:hypothetical protein
MDFKKRIFNLSDEGRGIANAPHPPTTFPEGEGGSDFNAACIDIFHFQYEGNEIYRKYVDSIAVNAGEIAHYSQIPFLPVSFFKTHDVITGTAPPEKIFVSSGTTSANTHSRHLIPDLSVYDESLVKGFENFYRPLPQYVIFALTPNPEQNPGSSLIYMISKWISASDSVDSGFYLDRQELMAEKLMQCVRAKFRILIIGLSYALMDFAEEYPMDISRVVIMETGGMKGKRPEMVREELHSYIAQRFHMERLDIHSEYGMTELLSQAYSKGEGRFKTPAWMKVLIRDVNDPLSLLPAGKTGGINIIDLANYNTCSFLAVQDLGKINTDGTFEVLGRFDISDLRGCNLMVD